MTVNLVPNKHIGIIFQPRSGSTVLRSFLKESTTNYDAGELFNHEVKTTEIFIINNEPQFIHHGKNLQGGLPPNMLYERSEKYLTYLSELTSIDRYLTFGIYLQSFMDHYPELIAQLSMRRDVQYFQLERADLLYSIISVSVSSLTKQFHNNITKNNSRMVKRDLPKFFVPVEEVERGCRRYIDKQKLIKKHFNQLPTLYYEQFQLRPANLMNLFRGIPKRLVSLSVNKFIGNYKDSVLNLDEIEDFYEQFVNDHIEFFPQYAGKIPSLNIPESQGRQPCIRALGAH